MNEVVHLSISGDVWGLLAWITIAVSGLLVGSFLTVVVERVPERESVVVGRSRCGSCRRVLSPRDMVPIVSWLWAQGRCRTCGSSIGGWVLAVEIATPLAALLAALRFGIGWDTAVVWVCLAALVAQSTIDLRTYRLPREISFTALAVVATMVAGAAFVSHDVRRLIGPIVGAVALTGMLALVRWLSRGGMGDGDVRFAPLLGTVLGWWDPSLVFTALVIASAAGAVVAILLAAAGDRRTVVPFGPFLSLGTVVALWFG